VLEKKQISSLVQFCTIYKACVRKCEDYISQSVNLIFLQDYKVRQVYERRNKCFFSRCLNVNREGKEVE